ncbi:MAG: hypothetical protein IJH47_00280 [Oscillospiraceae bacterium]|nr:hypothetical protein [Oscillospiraceae bacterium]
MKKKTILCLMLILSLLACFVTAMAVDEEPPVEPDPEEPYTGLNSASAGLSINPSTGVATCSCYVTLHAGYTANVYMTLQKKTNGSWGPYAGWTNSGSTPIAMSETANVDYGYQYRTYVKAVIYDSNGNYVEYGEIWSPVKSYP